MWPQTLQMTEDDCRSTLRRLELETYANVMGVFRAQGGLSDKKVKLLEELRCIFHISQDRHRAEARRVANDEHLSTIAKTISGPNTWQEWSREGRRSYPMLPRVAPQTALGWIAKNLAAEAALENAKLPHPEETAAAAMEEQAAILAASAAAEKAGFRYPEKYIVATDPFKMPDIPAAGFKKNLKRGINDSQQFSGSNLSKKRNTNELHPLGKNKNMSSNTAVDASITTNNRKAISLNRLQQQRFFYQQQQKAKKLAKSVAKREKAPAGPNKTGRKSKKLKEQQNQQIEQDEQFSKQDFSEKSYENQYLQKTGHTDSSTKNVGSVGETLQQHIDGVNDQMEAQSSQQQSKSFYLPLMVPQIAASKRDISRNLTKLQIPGQVNSSGRITGHAESGTVQNQALNSPSVGSQIVSSSKAVVDGKVAPLSTPVQKYIVEDRQPPVSGAHHSPVVSSSSSSPSLSTSVSQTTQQTSTTQYVALSQLPLPNKLRTLNTTIIPTGTKLSTTAKKLSGATILSATVVSPGSTATENIGSPNPANQQYLDSGGGNASAGSSSSNIPATSPQQQLSAPSGPTHTPPAVMQLHSNEVVRVGSQQTMGTSSTQSKVLTTKILPIVLSGNTPSTSFAKQDSTKNGSASAGSPSNFVTNSGAMGSTIIKSLSPSMFVSSQHSGFTSTSPVFSSFGSTGSVYRKHPNILKSNSSALSRTSSISSGGPQIISNIRLTPAITTGTAANSSFSMHQTQSGIFQQRSGTCTSSSGIRTSVKICQSPNGKVFIQPANLDTSKLTKIPSGTISQRILQGSLVGNGANLGSGTSNQPGSPHRIAIQKVQIIPAPMSGNPLAGSTQANQSLQQQQRLGTTSLTKGTFSGNIFVPTGTGLRSTKTSGAITLTKATFSNAISGSQSDLLSSSNVGSLVTKQQSDLLNKSSNVVVIDPHHTKLSSLTSNTNIARSNLDNSQMITEDTPVDIIVDNSQNMEGESSSTVTLLTRNVLENAQQSQQQQLRKQKQVPITVLNATDWEMELDQATAASLTHQQSGSNLTNFGDSGGGGGGVQFKQKIQKQTHIEQTEMPEAILIDDSFDDVIIEEEEHEETITDNEQYEEQGQQDMDIEVSDDHEIIMIDNLGNIDTRRSLISPRSNEDIQEVHVSSSKKTNLLDERVYKPISIESQMRTSNNLSPNEGNTKEITDLGSNRELVLVSDVRNPSESIIIQSKELPCNNHDESASAIHSLNRGYEHDSEFNSYTEIRAEAVNTKISASLFSVTEAQDLVENNSEVESDHAPSKAFKVSKERSFSKNDVANASD